MMFQNAADEIARLRYEAKRLRQLAAARRADLRALQGLSLGSRDPVAALKVRDRINEYTLAARQCDRVIAEVKAQSRDSLATL